MDTNNTQVSNSSLQISSGVIEKIARLAALEIEGVADVTMGSTVTQSLLGKIAQPHPIDVTLNDGVADIVVHLSVKYGVKIPDLSEKVQNNVKNSVQNMTSITVARVDIVVTGIVAGTAPVEE